MFQAARPATLETTVEKGRAMTTSAAITEQTRSRNQRIVSIASAIRFRLAPSSEGLADQPGTKIKTRWLLAGWAALSAVSAVGTAITPALIPFPLLMLALTPRIPVLMLAATHASPQTFFLVAMPRMLIGDPLQLLLGRRYGSRFVPTTARRLMTRFGIVAVALRPTGHVLAAAGAAGMTTKRVMSADVLGTLALLATIYTGTQTILS
jgi:hypothetical protein